MNRRHAIKLIGSAGMTTLLPLRLLAKEKSGASGKEFLPKEKFVVGHRGACAYAPENTLASYRIAMAQGADYVEQDLQVTRDGVLVCCHDGSLERVTNICEVFPNRFVEKVVKGKQVKQWPVSHFTVKEIKQLDAGSWFDPKFKDEKVPTWQEAIEEIKGKAGLCPEIKSPEAYAELNMDMEEMVVRVLKKNDLEKPHRKNSTPIFIQSFSKDGLLKLISKYDIRWPLLYLSHEKWTPEKFDEAQRSFAAIGPAKADITPSLVEQAHARGLKVISSSRRFVQPENFSVLQEEMRHLLDVGVDGLFSDNPDLFPRRK